jgi:hypothetical protein
VTSNRQIDANRRNAKLSTGPVTAEGKQRSRCNAIRHGLTAETVIDALEDADDYAAFEIAVTADFEAASAVERELVLRLASLLWRLRRATSIESGLFRIQAQQMLQLRQTKKAYQKRQAVIDDLQTGATSEYREANLIEVEPDGQLSALLSDERPSDDQHPFDNLTRSFVRLTSLPTCPLDRLSRYEAALWRQACQTLFALQFMGRRRPFSMSRKWGR